MKSLAFTIIHVFLLSLLFSCSTPAETKELAIKWEIEIGTGDYNQPVSKVGLLYNSQQFPILDQVDAPMEPVEKAKFVEKGVPENAVAACSGFWAGYEQTLVVTNSGDKLEVNLLTFEEGFETPQKQLIRTIPK